MNELLQCSAIELGRKLKRKEISPVELLELHIKRIEEVNPIVNAVTTTRFEKARTEAKQAEKQLLSNADDLHPLFGVPCTIKEFLAMKPAMMTTNAYVFKKDKKYLWTFASYDEETFSDRNVFPIGCIKELKKIEI